MNIYHSFVTAFSTFSRIPCPKIKWNENSGKNSLIFFPLVGVVVGLAALALSYLCSVLGFNNIFFAALATCTPMFITGGIHLDGYCDTVDALSSYQPKEKRLEILKDPNAGAFAVIKCCAFYILYFAAFTQLSKTGLFIVCIGFVVSRGLSALGIVNLKSAKPSGMLMYFKENNSKKTVNISMAVILLISFLGMAFIDIYIALAVAFVSVIVFIYYKKMAYKNFGGITGDINGYLLQLIEIFTLFAVVISEGALNL